MKLPFTLSLLALALVPCYAAVEEPQALYRPQTDGVGPSQHDFGGVGLLQMPTARMARVGEFSSCLLYTSPSPRD